MFKRLIIKLVLSLWAIFSGVGSLYSAPLTYGPSSLVDTLLLSLDPDRNGSVDIGGATALSELEFDVGNVARTNGSTDLETAATWFHVWVEWTTANGGSNGTLAVYISATGTKPGSPEINITNGDGDYPGIDRIEFKAVGQICFVVDQVLVDNAAIGNVP